MLSTFTATWERGRAEGFYTRTRVLQPKLVDTPPPTPPHRLDSLDYGILRRDRHPATLVKRSMVLEWYELTVVVASKLMSVGGVPSRTLEP